MTTDSEEYELKGGKPFWKKKRFLLVLALILAATIPAFAQIISNVVEHNVTVQDVTITSLPATDSVNATGFTETGTVTVSSPQTFTGRLTLTIQNVTTGTTSINAASFIVTINGGPSINGIAPPTGKTAVYIGATTSISNGTVLNYTVKFLSKADDSINGIQSGTRYQISQVVSQ